MFSLEKFFQIKERSSSVKQEVIAGVTTFLAMVYSVILIPIILGDAGFPQGSVFIATCLVTGLGSILIGLWANVPMAIGIAISLTAYTAYTLVLGQGVSIPVALGAVFIMGVVFTVISVTGIRAWILRNLPTGVAHGAGIGIGLFLLLVASNNVAIVVKNPVDGALPVKLGDFTSFPVMMSLIGLAVIIGLEKLQVKGGILYTIIGITILGVAFDPNVSYRGFMSLPSFGEQGSLFFTLDIPGALNVQILSVVFALVMTVVFDATGTIRAVAGQAGLITDKGEIINGGKALTSDSIGSVASGLLGASPTAVYIESAAGIAAGGKTGLTAVVVGVLFLATLFFQPLAALVPSYATAPALMYVGLLMLSNIAKLDFSDFVGSMSALVCAVFIVLTANIVTGIMLGFASLIIGRVISGDFKRLNVGTVIIGVVLVAFYASGYAL